MVLNHSLFFLVGLIGVIGIMGVEERWEFREFKEFREIRDNRLDSLCNNWFFGFGDYPRRGYDEKEIWSCQVYLNKLHISFLS